MGGGGGGSGAASTSMANSADEPPMLRLSFGRSARGAAPLAPKNGCSALAALTGPADAILDRIRSEVSDAASTSSSVMMMLAAVDGPAVRLRVLPPVSVSDPEERTVTLLRFGRAAALPFGGGFVDVSARTAAFGSFFLSGLGLEGPATGSRTIGSDESPPAAVAAVGSAARCETRQLVVSLRRNAV